MNNLRRVFLKTIALLSGYAIANPSYAFNIIDTDKIEIKLPKTAEKNASIPITITSNLTDIDTLTILAEKNPAPLVASFKLSDNLENFVSARLTLQESSNVIVLVNTKTARYRAKGFVKVIAGGCGA